MRPVSVFVRALAPVEGQRLKRLSKRAKHDSTRQRAMILLASATLMSPAEIAAMLLTDESHVREVIHDFNQRGFDSLRPRYGAGDPAGSRLTTSSGSSRSPAPVPTRSGCRSPAGALPKLSEYLGGQGIRVSPAHLARLLARAGLSFQRSRSWKASPDPDYEAKAARVLALYRKRPPGGVVISFDEMGPVSLRPQPGHCWARAGRPEHQRATYTRRHGIRYLVAALDVHADYLRARLRPGRDGASTLEYMRQIRLAYPPRRACTGSKTTSPAIGHPRSAAGAERHNVELVPTPTYASYLNRIESHFGAIGEFVVKNSDYLDWDSFGHAIARHIQYRNQPQRRHERLARRRTQLSLAA